jgi:hypothetical protein
VIRDSRIGRHRQLTFQRAVKATIIYFKTNVTEEVIGELLFVDQSTVSRAIGELDTRAFGTVRALHFFTLRLA